MGPQLSYASGHAEGEREVWETDFSGYTQTLQLDDHEAALLAAGTRPLTPPHTRGRSALCRLYL